MFILDVFSFKTAFSKLATKENFDKLREIAKAKIIEQVKANIPGDEKMQNVVTDLVNYISLHLTSSNDIVQWIIDHILISGIKGFAQAIYDDLKEVVKGL